MWASFFSRSPHRGWWWMVFCVLIVARGIGFKQCNHRCACANAWRKVSELIGFLHFCFSPFLHSITCNEHFCQRLNFTAIFGHLFCHYILRRSLSHQNRLQVELKMQLPHSLTLSHQFDFLRLRFCIFDRFFSFLSFFSALKSTR